MDKKQADRGPDEKSAEQGRGKYDPSKPESGRRMPEVPEGGKRFGQPEGHPIDKQIPRPGNRSGGKDILEGDWSDRESGRPVQLGEDDESETFSSGQPGPAGAEHGRGGRPQEGREDPKPYEAEKTKR
jgi:hypothetical protein